MAATVKVIDSDRSTVPVPVLAESEPRFTRLEGLTASGRKPFSRLSRPKRLGALAFSVAVVVRVVVLAIFALSPMSICTVRRSPTFWALGSWKKAREPGRQSEFAWFACASRKGCGTSTGWPPTIPGGTAIGLSGGGWPMFLILSTVLAQAVNAKPDASTTHRAVKRLVKRVMKESFVSLPGGGHCLEGFFACHRRTDVHRAGRRHNRNDLTIRGGIEHRDGVPFTA